MRTDQDARRVSKTGEGAIAGTVAYMSPEQAEGKKVDARSDIFSFGAVLYEMITGRRAFAGDSMISVLSAILRDEPKPAAELAHGIPRQIDRIIDRCLRKDPNRRYQHAGDLQMDLEQAIEDLTVGGGVEPRGDAVACGVIWWTTFRATWRRCTLAVTFTRLYGAGPSARDPA